MAKSTPFNVHRTQPPETPLERNVPLGKLSQNGTERVHHSRRGRARQRLSQTNAHTLTNICIECSRTSACVPSSAQQRQRRGTGRPALTDEQNTRACTGARTRSRTTHCGMYFCGRQAVNRRPRVHTHSREVYIVYSEPTFSSGLLNM